MQETQPVDAETREAAQRAIAFLRNETRVLPRGHSWRRPYTRQLVRLMAIYDEDDVSER